MEMKTSSISGDKTNSSQQVTKNIEVSKETDEPGKENDSKVEERPTFQTPALPAPSNKVQTKKKSLKSFPIKRAGLPSDIYQTPKIAQFLNNQPPTTVKKTGAKSEKTVKSEKPPTAVLEYETPNWSQFPPQKTYSLEVLKNGSILGTIDLSGKDYFTIGRLKDCDISMEHPLISRYHAVLQFGCPGETEDVELQKDGSLGLYLFDIGSTHGSFLNKVRIPNEKYFRIKVGHVMKFGGSSRMFILQGPTEDQEEVAKESIVELKDMYKKQKKEKEELAKKMMGEDSDEDENNEVSVEKVQSVTWGMSQDAVTVNSDDDSDDDKKKKGSKLPVSEKERFYVKDPVKALKHFYEQEKIEIEFEYTERRPGHWYARLEMPFDGPGGKAVYAESEITGKKKDAANACALEACKLLDKEGFFQQSEHHKKKVNKWKEADYYDSDEDEFLDRTGEIAKKRLLRMKRTGNEKETKAENYESLCSKVKTLENEVKNINNKLSEDKQATKVDESSIDPLEDFMKQIKSGKALDTLTRMKLKARLVEARKELAQTIHLADLARPASMPKLQTSSNAQSYSFIGKMKSRKKLGVAVPKAINSSSCNQIKFFDSSNNEESDEDERTANENKSGIDNNKVEIKKQNIEANNEIETSSQGGSKTIDPKSPDMLQESKIKNDKNKELIDNNNVDNSKYDKSENKSSSKRVMQPTLPPELRQKLLEESEKHDNDETIEISEPEPKRKRTRKPRSNQNKIIPNQYDGDDKYVTWVPPDGQSGDGSTDLNKKLGY